LDSDPAAAGAGNGAEGACRVESTVFLPERVPLKFLFEKERKEMEKDLR